MIPFLFIAAVILVIVGVGFYSSALSKRRREAIEEMAAELGLNFFPSGNAERQSEHSVFNLFSQGRGRKLDNLLEGTTDEVRISIFDYQYTVGSGKNQRTRKQTVASLRSPELNCPAFSMRPEGVFDRIGGMLGFQDIDFDSHPEFSKMFVLKGSNEEAIRGFFRPAVLEYFEKQSGISVEGQGQGMCLFRSGKTVPPDELKDLLSQAYEVFGCLVDA